MGVVIGYLFCGAKGKDEVLFKKLSSRKRIKIIFINIFRESEEKIIEKSKECDLMYNANAEDFSIEIVKTLEKLGKKVIDSSKTYYYIEDKWMFNLICEKNKIPIPKTILLSEDLDIAKRELKEFNQWPVILKRIVGTMGEFVEKAENIKQAEKIINKFWKEGAERFPIIAQEKINSFSYRVTVIGGKIIQAAIKENKGWKATGVYSKKDSKKFEIDNKLEKMIKKLSKITKIKICGVDLLKKEGKWLVLEVNSCPAFDFLEKEREKLISKTLDFLKKEAKNHSS